MHTAVLKYLSINVSIYLTFFMIFRVIEDSPSQLSEPYVWYIPVYPLIILPMILINILYLSGILEDLNKNQTV